MPCITLFTFAFGDRRCLHNLFVHSCVVRTTHEWTNKLCKHLWSPKAKVNRVTHGIILSEPKQENYWEIDFCFIQLKLFRWEGYRFFDNEYFGQTSANVARVLNAPSYQMIVEHSVKLVWVSFSNNAKPTTLVVVWALWPHIALRSLDVRMTAIVPQAVATDNRSSDTALNLNYISLYL